MLHIEYIPYGLRLCYIRLSGTCGVEGTSSVSSQANQAKVLTGGGDLREAQVDVPLSLAIPAFDRKAWLNNRNLNSNRGICLR